MKGENVEQPNVTSVIQNLYVVIGKKAVETDALITINKQHQLRIEALEKELKELKEDGNRPD